MQKIDFECDQCEVSGTIRLPDQFDSYRVESCPCCGSALDTEDYYDDEE